MIAYVYRKNVYKGESMRLLSYAISGLRLYENHECRMDLYAIDAVREPGYTHMLDGAARNISINTAAFCRPFRPDVSAILLLVLAQPEVDDLGHRGRVRPFQGNQKCRA